MSKFTCDFEACSRPSVRTFGECALCNRHLCAQHLQTPSHTCPKFEDEAAYDSRLAQAEKAELTELISKINTTALASRASLLRGGIGCSVPSLQYNRDTAYSMMGGMNYHVELCFEDAVKWIARIRRSNSASPPAPLRDYILESEVATLKFLEGTSVPSPRVFDYALEGSDNGVGVGYVLMEKLPGRPLSHTEPTQSGKRKVMSQLGDVFIELCNYPFDEMGSLDTPGGSHVGAMAQEKITDYTQAGMVLPGPFSSLREYHNYSIRLIQDLILRDEMYSLQRVDAYLIHRFLLDLVPYVLPPATTPDHKFYLKHADDKGDHILVDEDHNLTGIIDWEWAYTAPSALAFNSPIGLLDVAQFYDGINDICDDEAVFATLLEEKGRPDIAAHVRAGRVQHRFAFCCGYNLDDWDGFLGLFRGLREAVKVDDGLDWSDWRDVALSRYQEDEGLRELLAKQEDGSSLRN